MPHLAVGFYARRIFRAGEELQVGGDRGTLVGISAIQTLLESKGRTVAVPNSVFLGQAVYVERAESWPRLRSFRTTSELQLKAGDGATSLDTANALAHQYGGCIEAESRGPGHGAVFSVYLPAVPR